MPSSAAVRFLLFVFPSFAFASQPPADCATYELKEPLPVQQPFPGWSTVRVGLEVVSKPAEDDYLQPWKFRTLAASAFALSNATFEANLVSLFPDSGTLNVGQVINKVRIEYLRGGNQADRVYVYPHDGLLPSLRIRSDFDKLTPSQKNWVADFSKGVETRLMGLQYFECRTHELSQAEHLPAVQNLREFISEKVYLEFDADPFVTVGPMQHTISWLRTPNGDVVQMGWSVFQDGGLPPEGYQGESHFETREAAVAANIDLESDVNWQAWARLFWDGKEISSHDYSETIEWSGH